MIIEKPNRINITELVLSDPDKEREMHLRRKLFDYCSSEKMKTTLLEKWQRLPQGKDRILDAGIFVMLFPDARDELQLTNDDVRIVVDPPKQHTSSGWQEASALDVINLHGAGKLLFPRELADWKLDRDIYGTVLDNLLDDFTDDTRKHEYQYAFAISEKVLHGQLYPFMDESYDCGEALLDHMHKFYALRQKGFSTLDLFTIPGLVKILYPEKSSAFPIGEYDIQRVMRGIPDSPILDYPGLSVLLAKSMAAEEVTIDKTGAHFIPSKAIRVHDTSQVPVRRKF